MNDPKNNDHQVSVYHTVSREKRKAPEFSEKSWLNTKQNPMAKIQVATGLSQNKSDRLQQSW